MPFQLQAQTIIKSATLGLTGQQIIDLGDAVPHLQEVCESYIGDPDELINPDDRPESVQALDVVMELLAACASLAGQVGDIKPKRVIKRRKKAAK